MSEKGVRKASVGQAPLVRLVAEMNAAGNDSRLELYGQSHHAFDNADAGTDPKARLVHSPAAAARSRRSITEVLLQRTRPPG